MFKNFFQHSDNKSNLCLKFPAKYLFIVRQCFYVTSKNISIGP